MLLHILNFKYHLNIKFLIQYYKAERLFFVDNGEKGERKRVRVPCLTQLFYDYEEDSLLSPFTDSLLTAMHYEQQFSKVLSLANEVELFWTLPVNTNMVEQGRIFVFKVEVQRKEEHEVVEKVHLSVFYLVEFIIIVKSVI